MTHFITRRPVLAAILGLPAAMASSRSRAGEPDWPATLTIATASLGGTYHAYGVGLARLLSRALRIPVSERTTGGPAENIMLLAADEAQLAFVTTGVALQAWNGTGPFTTSGPQRGFRALFPMYDTPFHFVVRTDSKVQALRGLAGLRLGAGPQGGTSATYVPVLLAALGIEATIVNNSYDELAQQLRVGSIDALAAAAGAPFPAMLDLDRGGGVRFVPVSTEDIAAFRLKAPELIPATIPAGTYPTLNRPYPTVGVYNFAVATEALPDDLAYDIVDAVFQNPDTLTAAHPAAAATIPTNYIYNTFMPWHIGAYRWFGNWTGAGSRRLE